MVTHSKELAGEADEVILLRNGKIDTEYHACQEERQLILSSSERDSLDRLIKQTLNDKAKTIDFSQDDLNRLKQQIHTQIKQEE